MRIRDIVRSVSMYYSACIVGAIALLVPTAANAALKYEPSNYAARGNLLLQLDGIRNVGLLKAHDGDASQWIDLAAGNSVSFGNKTGSGVVSEWADDGYVFGGGEIGRLADAITLGNAFTIQLVFDADKSAQTANYPFFFDCGGDNCGFYTYKVDTNNQLIFRVRAVSGVSDVSIKSWTGRHYYATALYDKGKSSVFETETGTVTAGTTTTSVGARAFTIGGRWLGTASDNDRYLNGTIKAVRVYNKVLSTAELSQNRALDDARFFNGIPVTNVVVATAVAGLEGNEETGAYAFDAEGYTFSAPQKATLNGTDYICTGYKLETWDGSDWGAPVAGESCSYSATDTSAKVRLTWQWQEDDAPAPIGDAYIESDGTTFVNTGVMPAPDLRIEVDYALTEIVKDTKIFGAYTGSGQNAEYYVNTVGTGGYSFHVGVGWKGGTYLAMPDLNRHKVVFDIPQMQVQYFTGSTVAADVAIPSTAGLTATGTVPIGLFGRISNASGAVKEGTSATLRIYGAKFYKSDTLVCNLVPCVKGGIAGFRDTISGAFHSAEYNVSGLTAGGDVERIPDDGFIELTGNDETQANGAKGGHFIDTGYTPGQNTRIELDYALAENHSAVAADWYLLNAGNGTEAVALYQNEKAFGTCLGTAMWKGVGLPSQANAAFVRRTAVLDSANKAVTMMTAGYANYANTNDVFKAFSANAATTIKLGSTANTGGGYTPLRIYGLKIYESGSLVREYVPYVKNGAPGLKYDDTFVRVYWDANNGRNGMPKAGGDIAVSSDRDKDAYALFSGAQRIDTGYVPNGNTKLVVDFGFANGYNKPQQELFDAGGSGLFCRLYTQNGGGTDAKYSWLFNDNWGVLHSGIAVDHQRRLLTIDSPDAQTRLEPGATDGSVFNGDSTIASWTRSKSSPNTLVFGSLAVPDVSQGYMYAKVRLYRLTIYDGSNKVRDYVPVVENGVAGLRDLVHPESALLTAKGLTVSGSGCEGAEVWLATPEGCLLKKADAPKTLKAAAVGAVSYKWTKNGAAIKGGENGNLTVAWAKGGATDIYSVTPVYDVFGEEVEGTPVQVSVANVPLGMVVILR